MRKVGGKLLIIFAVILLAAAAAMGVTFAVRKGGVSTSYAADSAFSVGSSGYDDFASAMNAAKTTSSATQKIVTMNADYTLSSLYTLDAGYYVTLDLNGYTLDASSLENALDVYGTLTLQDGTDKYGTLTSGTVGVSRTSSGTKPYRTVYTTSSFSGSEANGMYDGSTTQSYKYYDSGAIIGCTESGVYTYYQVGTVRVLGDGTFNMYGGTITGANGYFGGVVNVCGTDAAGGSAGPVFNMYGGSLSGNTCLANAAGVMVSYGGEANLAGGIIAHNKCTNSGSNGIAVLVTGAGSSLSLGEYKTGLDIKTPLVISDNSGGYASGVGVSEDAVMYMYDGTEISNNVSTSSSAGGGAIGMTGGTVYMYGGNIIDNTAVNKGGAVYISGGTFVMSGGEVTFNGVSTGAYGYGSQPDYGGAFYVSGAFEMSGGTITTCVASVYGGAIYVAKSSSATMSGGTIMGCASYSAGGAVYVAGTGEFAMSGTADITLNSTSGTCGAGVFVESDATFDMSGGTIEKGIILMSSYGGVGVYVDGTFNMSGGTIKDNSFTLMSGIGGGVYLSSSGTMYMYGGEITGNSALSSAGGIYAAGSLHVMGEVSVTGNTCGSSESNIYLISGKYITLDGTVTAGSCLGITFASSSQTQVTTAETSTTYYRQSYFYFSMDVSSSGYMMGYSSGAYVEKILTTSLPFYVSVGGTTQYCIALGDALYLSSETGSPVILASSATVSETVTVEKGTSATIDLTGHTLTFSGQYTRLEIYGTLTITDSTATTAEVEDYSGESSCVYNDDGTYTTIYPTMSSSTGWSSYTSGAITADGNYTRYGYIDVFGGGTLNLESGSLCCTQNLYVAVLYMQGTGSSHASFNMTGGSLSGNVSTNNYGAIYGEYSDVRITGGVAAANTAGASAVAAIGGDCVIEIGGTAVISGNVGAYIIYVANDADLMVSDDAEISFNEVNSTKSTAGVVAVSAATFKLSGGTIAHNTVTKYGTVNVDAESGDATVLVSGDAEVYQNFVSGSSDTQSNIYLRSGDETLSIESGFSGIIGVTRADGNTERIAINSANLSQTEVRERVLSDEGRNCVCASDDGYIYFYENHRTGGVRIEVGSDGEINAWYVCVHCGDDDGDYDGVLSYGTEDGVAYVLAVGSDGANYYAELTFGIMVERGGDYAWYADAESLNADELTGGESITLLDDAEGTMEIAADVTIDLCGHALGGLIVSGGALEVTDSAGGSGIVYSLEVTGGSVSVSIGTYYRKDGDVFGYMDWSAYSCYVGSDDAGTYYKVIYKDGAVTDAVGATLSYGDGTNYRTIYYETLRIAADGGAFGVSGAELTLYADAEADGIDVSAQGVKINLRGHALTADVTIASGADLTICDIDENGNVGYGAVVGKIEAAGTLVVEGGTYAQDVFGCVAWDGALVGYVSDGMNAYTVASSSVAKSAASEAEALVIFTETYMVYYESFADAMSVAGITEGARVSLLRDVDSSALPTDVSAEVEIDIAGRSLYADIHVSGGGTLTMRDSAEDGDPSTGIVRGSLVAEDGGKIVLCGGTYGCDLFEEDTDIEIGDGDGVYLYVLNFDSTFTVMTEDDVTRFSAAAVTSGGVTKYYQTFETALSVVLQSGGTMILYADTEYSEGIELAGEGFEVTVDLNGHTLALGGAGLTIYADTDVSSSGTDGYGEGARLVVEDSSTSGTGKITGTIAVSGTHVDVGAEGYEGKAGEVENPYENTLKFIGSVSVNTDLKVSLESLNTLPSGTEETHTNYYFASIAVDVGETPYYGITTVHYHLFDMSEWYISALGEITFVVYCSCGEVYTYTDADGDTVGMFDLGTSYTVSEDRDAHAVTYSGESQSITFKEIYVEEGVENTHDVTRSFPFSITVSVNVKITLDGAAYYLEDEDTLDILLKNNTYESVGIELWRDVTYVFEFSGGEIAMDLGGHTLTGGVTLSGDAEMNITSVGGAMAGDITLCDSSSLIVGEDSGSGAVEIGGNITLSDTSFASIRMRGGNVTADNISVSDEASLYIVTDGGFVAVGTAEVSGTGSALSVATNGTDGSAEGGDVTGDITASDGATLDIKLAGGDITGDITVKSGAEATVALVSGSIFGKISASGEGTKIFVTLSSDGAFAGGMDITDGARADINTSGGNIEGGITVSASYAEITTAGGDMTGSVNADSSDVSMSLGGGTLDGSIDVTGTSEKGLTVTLDGGVITGDLSVSSGAAASVDLGGGMISGGISVGAGRSDTASLAISDTSGGVVYGEIAVFGGELEVSGGTYCGVDAGFMEYVAEGLTLLRNADGSYTVIAESGADDTYNAKVGAEDGRYVYYESLQDAVSAAAGQNGSVVLLDDVAESVVVSSNGAVTIDLNGKAVTGNVTVRSGAYLLVTDSQSGNGALYGNFTVMGTLEIEAGTYSQNVSRYVVSTYREERVLLAEENDLYALTYTVTTKDAAEGEAAASVTTGGVAVYYKDMPHAVAAVSGGCTLTLYGDVTADAEIESDNVTIDLNGRIFTGTIEAAASEITLTLASSANGGKIDGDVKMSGASCVLVFGEGVSLDITGTLAVTGDGSEVSFGNGGEINIEKGVSVGGDSAKIDLGGARVTAALTIDEGGTAYLDLDGGAWEGDVTVANQSSVDVKLKITDSTATYSTEDGTRVGIGEGILIGSVDVGGGEGTLEMTAGAFETETDITTYLGANLTVIMGDGVAYVVSDNLAEELSVAYSETTGTYYTSVYAAVSAVACTGGTVTLLSDDAMADAAEIFAAVEIDLDGHTLVANFIVKADEGGSLRVFDSAYDENRLTANLLTGTIVVEGEGGDTKDTDKYEDTLIFTDGIKPTGDVEIDLESLDGTSCNGYSFGETGYAGSGVYGITTGYTHIHNYNIESWTIDYDGRVTLTILCACGEADPETESDDYIAKTVEITAEGDGSFTFEATVIVGEGDDEATYVCRKTVVFAATVTDAKGKTYYFETLQEAVDFVAGYDGCTITLQSDVTENITIPSDGNDALASVTVTMDLNGKSMTGSIVACEGVLTIYGDGYVYGEIAADGGTICLRGGSYTSKNVPSHADDKEGYAALYTADGFYVVMAESYAQGLAAASVTSPDGTALYYENLGDVVLSDGATLTLYADASATYIEIDASDVTLDLNGYDVGEIDVVENGSAIVVGEGFVDTSAVWDKKSLEMAGGSYDDEAAVFAYLAEGFAAVLGDDGVYRVVSEDEALSFATASLETEGGETLYFDTLQSALAYANVNGLNMVALVNDSEGDIEIYGDVTLDLVGSTLYGGICVSDGIELVIVDSAEDGLVTGAIDVGAGSGVTLSGGSFADDSFLAYLGENVAYRNADGSFTPMTEQEARDKCGVCVTYVEKNTGATVTVYCETVEIATEYAVANEGMITLCRDMTWSGAVPCGEMEIDLAGHALKAEIAIAADSDDGLGKGASVRITDSVGDGKVTGTVTVEGAGDENEDDNSYAGTFVLEGGVKPGGNLTVDLSSLFNLSNGGYFFSSDNTGDYTVYRIAAASEHTPHVYDIEVWDIDGEGNAVLQFMCACGEYESDAYGDRLSYTGELTIDDETAPGSVTYKYAVTVDGVEHTYSETFAYNMCVELDNGKTLYFASVYDALTYTSIHGGTAKLTEDVTEDVNIWDKGLIIDLDGHTLTTNLDILAGASLTVCGKGEIVCAITSSGTLTLDGNMTVTLSGDAVGTERGRMVLSGNIVFDLGGRVFTGAPEIADETTFTMSGGEFYLIGNVTLGDGAKINVAGDATIDLNGYALTGDIDVADGAVLVITDTSSKNAGRYEGTINVPYDEAGLEIYRGCIDLSDILDGTLVVDVATGYVFASLAQQDGSTYYKVVTAEEHEELGHGYDIQSSTWVFDLGTSTLTLYFTCLCGETVSYSFYLSEDFYETFVVFYDYEEVLPDGSTQSRQVALSVELEYEISSLVVADNGVTYSFAAYGVADLPGFVEENDGYLVIPEDAWYEDNEGNLVLNLNGVEEVKDGVGYRYTCIVEATCERTGEVIYEYGNGKGVIVRVTSGAYHRGIQLVTSETEGYEDLAGYDDRYEVYYCPKCGKIFVNSSDAVKDKGYDDLQDVVEDMDRSDAFEEEKDSIQDQLDETMTGCMGEAGGSVSESYEKAVEDLDDWEFEFDGGRTGSQKDEYLERLMENIDAILEWATLEINKQEYATITEGQITELYNELLRSGLYDETVLRYEYDDIIQCLTELVVESLEEIEEVYTAYLEKSLQDLQNINLLPGQTLSSDTSDGGTEGEITIEGTVAGLTKLVITRELVNVSLDDRIAEGDLVAANDTLEGDLSSYVDGKKVLAVYGVTLIDTVNDTELALFEGTYTITIKLSSGLVGIEGLQILYVGDDGRVEVYDTTLSEDGQYITFTTTHLSRYVLVGSDETDLTVLIYFFGITMDIEVLAAIALLVVFLVMRSKNGSGRKSRKVASIAAALLATVVPAGGVTWTVLLAVGCVVMLVVDMLMVYGILNERRKASLALEETDECDGEDVADKTEKADK